MPTPRRSMSHPPLGLVAVLALALAGCQKDPGVERFFPEPQAASAALTAALREWQAGTPPGHIATFSRPLYVVDSQRRPGQKLEEFEILGEVPGSTRRCFAVRLRFSSPSAEETARYVVVGDVPLWIFRHEDYEVTAHWEHPQPIKPLAPAKSLLESSAPEGETP